MLVHFMDVFPSGEDLGVRLFHFPLEFLSLFRAIEEGFDEGGFVGWRCTDDGNRGEGTEGEERYSIGGAKGGGYSEGKMSIH